MSRRILNPEPLASHGDVVGRQAVVEILEAGLRAADPYHGVLDLVRLEGRRLVVGHPDYEPVGDPRAGRQEVFDLARVGRIFVFGAGKGVQRAARALEDVLGDRLTGGQIIAKHEDDLVCERLGVTYGPGGQFWEAGLAIPCLAGGIVDGETVAEARAAGVDLREALRRHDTSPALWKLRSGVLATHGISLLDLRVILIADRS